MHQLTVHTVGGVVTASEPVMLIVPDGDALSIEARVDPNEINQVSLGQTVLVRFPGLGQRTTPEINGAVSLVSADLSQDEKSGAGYYMIRVALTDDEVARLGAVKLRPACRSRPSSRRRRGRCCRSCSSRCGIRWRGRFGRGAWGAVADRAASAGVKRGERGVSLRRDQRSRRTHHLLVAVYARPPLGGGGSAMKAAMRSA